MKIKDILGQGKPTLSFEVFPPKTEDKYESVERAAAEIAKLKPAFMSVTYGAGGGTSRYTVDIASTLHHEYQVTALAHVTCVSSTREKVHEVLEELKAAGIENILALRGDVPKDGTVASDYRFASELIREIRAYGDFCIGAACYPEGHVESVSKTIDMDYLKQKVEAGCGIMPVTNVKQIIRSCQLSGTYLPSRFKAIVDRFGDNPAAMKQAGIAYATEQIIDLIANGVDAIHVYSMNKPDVAAKIKENLSEILS